MPRCCDPSRALASLKPNLAAMLTNPTYDLAITSPLLLRPRAPPCGTAGAFFRAPVGLLSPPNYTPALARPEDMPAGLAKHGLLGP